MSFTLVISSL